MKANIYAKTDVLSALIAERGMTQSELAERAGVTRHTVRNALDGRPVSSGFVAGIGLALGVDFADLFTIRALAADAA